MGEGEDWINYLLKRMNKLESKNVFTKTQRTTFGYSSIKRKSLFLRIIQFKAYSTLNFTNKV